MKKFIWIFLFFFSVSAFAKKLISIPLTPEEKNGLNQLKMKILKSIWTVIWEY